MGALFETAGGEKEVHILTLRSIRCPSCRLVLAWNDEPRDIECHAEIDHPKNSVARVYSLVGVHSQRQWTVLNSNP